MTRDVAVAECGRTPAPAVPLIDALRQLGGDRVVILSPHADDAALSIPCTLVALSEAGVELRLVTCFSRSAHVRSGATSQEVATAIRKAEDRDFASLFHEGLPLVWLDYLDAPLRECRRIFTGAPLSAEDDQLAATIVDSLQPHRDRRTAVLAPLALGAHVDHRLTHRVAQRLMTDAAWPPAPVFFYEDLPYAGLWTPATLAASIVGEAREAGARATPYAVRHAAARDLKRRAAACYPSQVSDAWLVAVETYAAGLEADHQDAMSERLWRWTPLQPGAPIAWHASSPWIGVTPAVAHPRS